MPATASAIPVVDKLAFDAVRELHKRRVQSATDMQMQRFVANPHVQQSIVLLGPHGDELGILTAFGLQVAVRERLACLQLLEHFLAPLERLATTAAASVTIGEPPPVPDDVAAEASALLAMGVMELAQEARSLIAEHRGPLEPRDTVLPGHTEWTLATKR